MVSIALSERYEQFIKKQLESGRYNNASEVVRAGLRMLEDYEDAREHWLRNEIVPRMDDLKQKPEKAVPLETVFEELEIRHKARVAKDQ